MNSKFAALFKLELLLEWRNKYALAGIVVYVLSCVLVIKFIIQYSGQKQVSAESRIALFWLVLLFSAVNAIANAFSREPHGRKLYYLWLTNPSTIIVAKLLYNFMAASVLSLIAVAAFYVVMDFGIVNHIFFLLSAIAGSCGYAFVFTTVGAVASGSKNNASLLAILGMPLVIPLLIFISKLSLSCLQYAPDSSAVKNLLLLISFDLIIAVLAYILFPYLWRD